MRMRWILLAVAVSIFLSATVEALSPKEEMERLRDGYIRGRCRSCHPVIEREQLKSLHAKVAKDKTFASRFGKGYDPLRFPRPVLITGLDKPVQRRSENLESSVGCLSCHLGPDGTMHGPEAKRQSTFHGITPDRKFFGKTGSVCLICHGNRAFPKMNLAEGYRMKIKKGGKTCIDCHMPRVRRAPSVLSPRGVGRSHEIPVVTKGAEGLIAEIKRGENGSEIILKNVGVHPVPFLPERALVIQLFKIKGRERETIVTKERDFRNPIRPGEDMKITTLKTPQAYRLRVLLRLSPSEPPERWVSVFERELK
jgi:hypothetical protein